MATFLFFLSKHLFLYGCWVLTVIPTTTLPLQSSHPQRTRLFLSHLVFRKPDLVGVAMLGAGLSKCLQEDVLDGAR